MARISQRTRIFVGCEGASERSYVKWIQDMADGVGLRLHFDPQIAGGGDPLAVVEESISALRKRESLQGKFARKAVLLDKDRIGQSPGRDQRIGPLVARHGLVLIYQEWEHEALLLRHYLPSRNLRPPAGASLPLLRVHWPNYSKPADALDLRRRLLLENLNTAISVEPDLRSFLHGLGFA